MMPPDDLIEMHAVWLEGPPVVLWLPQPPDNANTKRHWGQYTRKKNAFVRELAWRAMARQLPPPPDVPIAHAELEAAWHYPDGRHHIDDDNVIRRLKPVVDWLVRMRYLAGDRTEHVTWRKPITRVGVAHPPMSTVCLTLIPVPRTP